MSLTHVSPLETLNVLCSYFRLLHVCLGMEQWLTSELEEGQRTDVLIGYSRHSQLEKCVTQRMPALPSVTLNNSQVAEQSPGVWGPGVLGVVP